MSVHEPVSLALGPIGLFSLEILIGVEQIYQLQAYPRQRRYRQAKTEQTIDLLREARLRTS